MESGDEQVKGKSGIESTPKVESKLPVQSQRLMELIFNQSHFDSVLANINYDANKLPLGKLSKATLKQGFDYLSELANLIRDPKLADSKHGVSHNEVCRYPIISAVEAKQCID